MNKIKVIGGMMLVALNSVTGTASAVVTSETVVDFSTLTASAITGLANLDTLKTSGTTAGKVYTQNGIAVGVVADPLSTTVHLHQEPGTPTGTAIYYGNDTSGIYFRTLDGTAFSFSSMLFNSSYSATNPHTTVASAPGGIVGDGGAHDFWDIYGFSTASNPGLLTGNLAADGFTPTDPNSGFPAAPVVAYATVANGFDGILNVLALDGNFKNVGSVWIHYDGFPHDPNVYVNPNDPNAPGTYAYGLIADNLTLNQAVTASAVPVPGAVWLFATGMAGLMSFGRRKSALAA